MAEKLLDYELSKARRNDTTDSNLFVCVSMWEDWWGLRSRNITCPQPIGVYDKAGRKMKEAFDAFCKNGGTFRRKKVSLALHPLRIATKKVKPKKQRPTVTSSSSEALNNSLSAASEADHPCRWHNQRWWTLQHWWSHTHHLHQQQQQNKT